MEFKIVNHYIMYPYYIMSYINYTLIKNLNNKKEDGLAAARGYRMSKADRHEASFGGDERVLELLRWLHSLVKMLKTTTIIFKR